MVIEPTVMLKMLDKDAIKCEGNVLFISYWIS